MFNTFDIYMNLKTIYQKMSDGIKQFFSKFFYTDAAFMSVL